MSITSGNPCLSCGKTTRASYSWRSARQAALPPSAPTQAFSVLLLSPPQGPSQSCQRQPGCCRGQKYVGAFLRRAPPGEEGDQRGQQSSPEGREAVEQLHEVGILARVENMARHDSVQGAQLLLYGHQRIKRLEVVGPLSGQQQRAAAKR